MWLSLFVAATGTAARPAGLYAVAFADYRTGGVLDYRELLVARLVRDGVVPRVTVTDAWVDSPASRDGGRSLWAIPKELADLHVAARHAGPAALASGDASVNGSPVAAARFTGVRVPTVRTPFAFTVGQEREDGTTVVTPVSGSSHSLPVLGRWDFGADGPLAWLHGRTAVGTIVLSDVRLNFGR